MRDQPLKSLCSCIGVRVGVIIKQTVSQLTFDTPLDP